MLKAICCDGCGVLSAGGPVHGLKPKVGEFEIHKDGWVEVHLGVNELEFTSAGDNQL
jgi:hypothetical protein